MSAAAHGIAERCASEVDVIESGIDIGTFAGKVTIRSRALVRICPPLAGR